MLLDQLLTVGTSLTRGTLLAHICTNSTTITSEYRWWLVLRSIPSPFLAIWIRNSTNVGLKMGCIFATTTWTLCCDFLLTLLFLQAVTAIQNMACQHRELHLRLEDAQKLRLYAQSIVSKQHALDDTVVMTKAKSKHWEQEAKAGAEKIASAEKEKDEAKEEAQFARIVAIAKGNAKALAEDNLTRVQDALAVAEKARRKVEDEVARLEVEQTSLLLKIGAVKDEVSSLYSQAGKDKEAMEEDYQKALEFIFAYGYGCCVLKHNICGDQLEVPDDMSDSSSLLPIEFFMNSWCPPTPTPTKATTTKAEQSKSAKKAKEPEMSAPAQDFARTP